MEDLVSIREKINQMAELTLSMLKTTFDGFMKHDLEILSKVLKDEERLNEIERKLTFSLVEISKGKIREEDKRKIISFTNIISDLEQIGDYIKDIIERVEIKIQERLLFSEEGLSEYKHLYSIVETALQDLVKSLNTDDKTFAKRSLCEEEYVDELIQKYRNSHAKRLISGICDPRAANMFLNLLDFTGQIFHHIKSIAKSILEIK